METTRTKIFHNASHSCVRTIVVWKQYEEGVRVKRILSCVRTIVVWKHRQSEGGKRPKGCVRTIVVWKRVSVENFTRLVDVLRENHSGMETY